MDRQLQKVTDPEGLEIIKGTKVNDSQNEGFVININEAFIDYSDVAKRDVLYCPQITVRFIGGFKVTYNTYWNEVGARVLGKQMVFICEDLEVVE